MLMLQYSQSSLNELLNSDRHVDHDRHLQSQPTSEGAYTMLSLKIPQILVDRDRQEDRNRPQEDSSSIQLQSPGYIHPFFRWIVPRFLCVSAL